MPLYLYRREDGSTFELRQSFSDNPLTMDPETGQSVVRVVQAAGVIFKGSGFYVNDSKGASRSNLKSSSDTRSDSKSDSKSDATASESKTASSETPASKPAETTTASADTKAAAK
jgi:putative FmdB family regulatory protein